MDAIAMTWAPSGGTAPAAYCVSGLSTAIRPCAEARGGGIRAKIPGPAGQRGCEKRDARLAILRRPSSITCPSCGSTTVIPIATGHRLCGARGGAKTDRRVACRALNAECRSNARAVLRSLAKVRTPEHTLPTARIPDDPRGDIGALRRAKRARHQDRPCRHWVAARVFGSSSSEVASDGLRPRACPPRRAQSTWLRSFPLQPSQPIAWPCGSAPALQALPPLLRSLIFATSQRRRALQCKRDSFGGGAEAAAERWQRPLPRLSFSEQPIDSSQFIGAPGGIRTPDHLVRSQVLYPTELRAPAKRRIVSGGRVAARRMSPRATGR